MKRYIPFVKKDPIVPLIRLHGAIAASRRGPAMSDAGLAPLIERAFTRGKPAAVALLINSPGGSPVQSSLIAARIRRLADDKGLKVHAFVEDIAASGGYWLATAADDIWIDASSIVGSIGVISASFGFSELIARYGIERRVHTAGQSKSMLDPFKPEKDDDVARLKALQEEIHKSFIAHVKARRGARLADGDLFTGDIWIGQQACEVGLADGIAHATPKLKELYGARTKIVPYQRKRPFLSRFGAEFAADAAGLVEERAAFARFGI